MKPIALALTCLVTSAGPLAAQHARHFPPPQPVVQPPASIPPPQAPTAMRAQDETRHGMDPLGMMDTMELLLPPALRFAPGRLLEREHELRLTPEQASRLAEMAQRGEAARAAAMAGYMEQVRLLRESLAEPDPDAALAEMRLQAVQEVMGAAHRAHLRAALEARAVLTGDQRRLVEAVVQASPGHDGAAAGGHLPRPAR